MAPKTSQLFCFFFPPQSTSAAGHGIHDNTLNSPIIVKEERQKSIKDSAQRRDLLSKLGTVSGVLRLEQDLKTQSEKMRKRMIKHVFAVLCKMV